MRCCVAQQSLCVTSPISLGVWCMCTPMDTGCITLIEMTTYLSFILFLKFLCKVPAAPEVKLRNVLHISKVLGVTWADLYKYWLHSTPQASHLVYVVSYIITLAVPAVLLFTACFVVVNIPISTEIQCEFIMCQEMSLAPFCSLDASLWVRCRMFQGRNGYFGYLGKSQNLLPFQALVWQIKKGLLLSGEGSVNTKNRGLAGSAAAFPTVPLWHLLPVKAQTFMTWMDGFKPWINCILHFPAALPASFVARAFQHDPFGPLIPEHSALCKWCQIPLMLDSAGPTAQKLPHCFQLYINV